MTSQVRAGAQAQEWLRPDFGYQLRQIRWLLQRQTGHQWLQVGEHPWFGRVLRLDRAFQCSEADEFFYHEPLVHSALLTARRRRRVLIIGGGDGGAAEEALKWPDVGQVDQVEIDGAVIDAARLYLGRIHRGVLDGVDDRFRLVQGDGREWLQQAPHRYDTVLLDLTDAGGPSTALWQQPFYRLCAHRLAPGGVLALHVAAPWAQLERCVQTLAALGGAFRQVDPFVASVPMSGGAWLMALCHQGDTERPALAAARARLRALSGPPLQALDAHTFAAQFALPPYLQRALLPGDGAFGPQPSGEAQAR